jgi:hypothetical protein
VSGSGHPSPQLDSPSFLAQAGIVDYLQSLV